MTLRKIRWLFFIASLLMQTLFMMPMLRAQTVLKAKQIPINPIFGDPHHLEPVTGSWNPWRIQQGYALGVMTNIQSRPSISLLFHSLNFFYTLEGDLRLGQYSTAGGILHQSCFDDQMRSAPSPADSVAFQRYRSQAQASCTEPVNPWHFSDLDQSLLLPISRLPERYVLIYFNSYIWVPLVESDNMVARIYSVDPDIMAPGATFSIPVPSGVTYRDVFVDGRVVIASLDGIVRKAHEVIVQQSNAGNHFQDLSVNDDRMFNFILKAMSSGRFLRIYYYSLKPAAAWPGSLIFGYNTPYRVYKVEVLPEASPQQTPGPQP